MKFDPPLIEARLRRRYKRFLADVELDDGSVVTAHVANPGAMTGLLAGNARVWLSESRDPARKLRHSWELVEVDGTVVGVNAARPNALVAEALAAGRVPELTGYAELRREVRHGARSRIDLLLREPGRRPCYVEIKNVHLRRTGDLAEFPDSVTTRGARHLRELAEAAGDGARAVMLYVVQRADCARLGIAGDIDPVYARAFEDARARGVEAYCYACNVTPDAIELDRRLPLAFRGAPS